MGQMTVHEVFMFTAALRLPGRSARLGRHQAWQPSWEKLDVGLEET